MRYVKKEDGRMIEYFGRTRRPAYYRENGWFGYDGNMPPGRLDMVDGKIVELPEPAPPPRVFSKLAILEELDKLDLRESFETELAKSAHFWRWDVANEIREDYEGVSEVIELLEAGFAAHGIEVETLLDRCQSV